MKNIDDEPHRRGRLFQELIRDLLSLSYCIGVVGSHNVKGREVDAAFEWDGRHCRVEAKWERRSTGPGDFDEFKAKLEFTAETRGIFISMAGFTEKSIARADEIGREKPLILIDGNEIVDIFEGRTRIDVLLDQKIRYYRVYGSTFNKFTYENDRAYS